MLSHSPEQNLDSATMVSPLHPHLWRWHCTAVLDHACSINQRRGHGRHKTAKYRAQRFHRPYLRRMRVPIVRLRLLLFREDLESADINSGSAQAQHLDPKRSTVFIWTRDWFARRSVGIARRFDRWRMEGRFRHPVVL